MQVIPQNAAHQDPDQGFDFHLLEAIVNGSGQLSRKDSETIRERVRAWVNCGGERRLLACLRWMPSTGERSIATQLAELRRLAAFVEAWKAIPVAYKDASAWDRCDLLACELKDFETMCWPAWRDNGLPAQVSKLRLALFTIFSALERRPAMSTKGIYELLKRARVLT